jgi:hypothetical protein
VHEKILLAGGAWRPRAIVLAQLVEEGYDVTAVETWDETELLLRKRAVKPSVVVFDLEDEQQPDAAMSTLVRLIDPARVLVLAAATTLPAAAVRSHGFAHVLARPYSVGDVVKVVTSLARPTTRTTDQRPGLATNDLDERPTTWTND